MKPQDRITELEKQLAAVIEQRDGLKRRVDELLATKPSRVSKVRLAAEQALALLEQGPVTLAKLRELHKYPEDVVSEIRHKIKMNLNIIRTTSGSIYMTDAQHASYLEAVAKLAADAKAVKTVAAAPAPVVEAAQATA